ncbi:E3 ubiquitin-protein ligase PUB23 [Cinnamomum micranthum f. kanehirae]|uniref:U-box domain-containing protein n=1 Tax=Cinnamomum micranthum f. kanehirae TaxID=337451 RepID=A0A3S3N4K6_9MAGN|nr:E3 ubiquitin-protein ligase PUB23 [Cinnamomum micranthum f. kanehirae]
METVSSVNDANIRPEESVVERDDVGVGLVSKERIDIGHEEGTGLAEELEHGFDDMLDEVGFEGAGRGRVGGLEACSWGDGGGDFDGIVEVEADEGGVDVGHGEDKEGGGVVDVDEEYMEEVAIPHYFLCPISLEIMRDPVTLCSGITYDRESIEQWIFCSKNKTCPITRQPLPDLDMTPNHTLRRLIQAWCVTNAANGIERIPTPKPPVDKEQIIKLLEEAMNAQTQIKSLLNLMEIATQSERNKRVIEAAGAVSTLSFIVKNNYTSIEEVTLDGGIESTRAGDEALTILYNLQLSEEGLRNLAVHLLGLKVEVLQVIVDILRDQISHQATKAALEILIEVCPWGRNRIKAARAGAVSVLIELLLDTDERRACEMILVVLDQLCKCAEGRAELVSHNAGIAIVTKKILRVSPVASERAVRILHSIATFSANSTVIQEMLQVGVVSKLCLVLQVDCEMKNKLKAKEILVRHAKAWKDSPCIPLYLLSSYPSNIRQQ